MSLEQSGLQYVQHHAVRTWSLFSLLARNSVSRDRTARRLGSRWLDAKTGCKRALGGLHAPPRMCDRAAEDRKVLAIVHPPHSVLGSLPAHY